MSLAQDDEGTYCGPLSFLGDSDEGLVQPEYSWGGNRRGALLRVCDIWHCRRGLDIERGAGMLPARPPLLLLVGMWFCSARAKLPGGGRFRERAREQGPFVWLRVCQLPGPETVGQTSGLPSRVTLCNGRKARTPFFHMGKLREREEKTLVWRALTASCGGRTRPQPPPPPRHGFLVVPGSPSWSLCWCSHFSLTASCCPCPSLPPSCPSIENFGELAFCSHTPSYQECKSEQNSQSWSSGSLLSCGKG